MQLILSHDELFTLKLALITFEESKRQEVKLMNEFASDTSFDDRARDQSNKNAIANEQYATRSRALLNRVYDEEAAKA